MQKFNQYKLYQYLGAHVDSAGIVHIRVFAPGAKSLRIKGRDMPLIPSDVPGVWEIHTPDLKEGDRYRFVIETHEGTLIEKNDPFAFSSDNRNQCMSVIRRSHFHWNDEKWMSRKERNCHEIPLNIYKLHLATWKQSNGHPLNYRELAPLLVHFCLENGFTHIEPLPITEYPFDGSWGYQALGYFSPTSRYGVPDDLKYLIDALHMAGIGIIFDLVLAHFAPDDFGLEKFDGTTLFERGDLKEEVRSVWGSELFDFSSDFVRRFLISSALYWMEEFHVDGFRVDAVSCIIYENFAELAANYNHEGRVINEVGMEFLREFSKAVKGEKPECILISEEIWNHEEVTKCVESGGLGFDFNWHAGWAYDTLAYFSVPLAEREAKSQLLKHIFSYTYKNDFVLAISHDEVKKPFGSVMNRLPGTKEQKIAQLKQFLFWQVTFPGKKLLFMGTIIGETKAWSHEGPLNWDLDEERDHGELRNFYIRIAQFYHYSPALWERDSDESACQVLEDVPPGYLVFIREGKTQKLLIVLNLLSSENAAPVSQTDGKRPVFSIGRNFHEPFGGAIYDYSNDSKTITAI